MLAIGNRELTPEQRLSKAVVAVMSHDRYKALAPVLMIGEKKVVDDIPTACTDGHDCMFGRKFIEAENDAALRFTVVHEDYHKMHRDFTTWENLWEIDPRLANQAVDHVRNLQIMDEAEGAKTIDGMPFLEVPKSVEICYDTKFRGMTAAQVFKALQQKREEDEQNRRESPTSGDGGEQQQGEGAGFDEHDWKGKELSPDEQRDMERELDQAIRQGHILAGKGGGGEALEFGDLLKTQVDWREVLREFVTTTCVGNDYSTWSRPNRRLLGQDIYLPSGISEKVEDLVVAVDTSYSVGNRELNVAKTEIKSICDTVEPDMVRLLYWGSRVVGDETYTVDTMNSFVTSTRPKCGGGTEVKCVTDYMQEKAIKPQAAIVITDGYVSGWSKWDCPVLWVIIDNEGAKPNVGKYVHVRSEEMK
tara:strand:- start:1568 stop:2821 length:1254 start_codon:yes stop_codon:yes gene_type:complete